MAKRPPIGGRRGRPLTDLQRLKRHFGKDWKKHKVSELPKRGTGRRRRR